MNWISRAYRSENSLSSSRSFSTIKQAGILASLKIPRTVPAAVTLVQILALRTRIGDLNQILLGLRQLSTFGADGAGLRQKET